MWYKIEIIYMEKWKKKKKNLVLVRKWNKVLIVIKQEEKIKIKSWVDDQVLHFVHSLSENR
jgi:hypothetical protein